MNRLACGLGALAAAGALAQPPSLSLPIACQVGSTCIVQNHVDHDPGPGARDYRCGRLAYDGHKGTDLRVTDVAAFREGVAVLAAAPGRVRAVRDGMADASVRETGPGAVAGREAGNAVVIDHGDGWVTQYAHMRGGSVAVRPGEQVERGQKLGLAGLSGNTEFPHLHFEVRAGDRIVDPFVGTVSPSGCGPGTAPLWNGAAADLLAYSATGLLAAGLSGAAPRLEAGTVDPHTTPAFRSDSEAVVFWVQVYGAQEGDLQELRLLAPDGRLLAERVVRIERNLAQSLAYVGLRRRDAAWAGGVYRAEYSLRRGSPRREVVALAREAAPEPMIRPDKKVEGKGR